MLRQLGQGGEYLAVGVLAEILDADVAGGGVYHVGGAHTVGNNVVARHREFLHAFLLAALHAYLHLRAFLALQAVHGLGIGHLLAHKGLAVYHHYLVAGKKTGTVGRTVLDHVLYAHGVLADHKLYAYTREGTFQVVRGHLHLVGADVHGVGVELGQYQGHGFLHQVVKIHTVHILVVDDVEQVVQTVAA